MRDKKFLDARKKMTPILFSRFHFLVKKAKVQDDRKSLVEDLISWTMLEALRNSRKERHLEISCEQLIRIKATNVWAEFQRELYGSFNHANHAELTLEWVEDTPAGGRIPNSKIDWLLENADEQSSEILNKRLDGYEVREIADMYGTTEGAITMKIQRLKKKLRGKY